MSGYSKTPLPQKLGLKPDAAACVLHAPAGYAAMLGYALESSLVRSEYDWLQAFFMSRDELSNMFATLKTHVAKDGQLWISWPKKAAKQATDLDENIVREIGLTAGLVDVKVAAIDDTWSALKFVYRLQDR
jgi:hypothetical protein